MSHVAANNSQALVPQSVGWIVSILRNAIIFQLSVRNFRRIYCLSFKKGPLWIFSSCNSNPEDSSSQCMNHKVLCYSVPSTILNLFKKKNLFPLCVYIKPVFVVLWSFIPKFLHDPPCSKVNSALQQSFISNRINIMGQVHFQATRSQFNVVALPMKRSSSALENGLQSPFVVVNHRQNVLLVLYDVNSCCPLTAQRINKESDTNQFCFQHVSFLQYFITFYPENLRNIICHIWEWITLGCLLGVFFWLYEFFKC